MSYICSISLQIKTYIVLCSFHDECFFFTSAATFYCCNGCAERSNWRGSWFKSKSRGLSMQHLPLAKSTHNPASTLRCFCEKKPTKLMKMNQQTNLTCFEKFAKKTFNFNKINPLSWSSLQIFLGRPFAFHLIKSQLVLFVTSSRAILYIQFIVVLSHPSAGQTIQIMRILVILQKNPSNFR